LCSSLVFVVNCYFGSCLKVGFGFKVKAGGKVNPQEYFQYFEDLTFSPNAEIGPKGSLATASN